MTHCDSCPILLCACECNDCVGARAHAAARDAEELAWCAAVAASDHVAVALSPLRRGTSGPLTASERTALLAQVDALPDLVRAFLAAEDAARTVEVAPC